MANKMREKCDVADNLSVFRDRLRQLIDEHGFTYADVEFYTGIAAPTISRYLGAQRLPDIEYLLVLCKYFNVSADWMLGLSSDADDPDVPEVVSLYNRAKPDDKAVVDMVLKKYK